MLKDEDILSIIKNEEMNCIGFDEADAHAQKRIDLLNAYNRELYGDEVEGESKAVVSDVADVVESLLPPMLELFYQKENIVEFDAEAQQYEDEADQKTKYANHIFTKDNQGFLVLHNFIKDGFLQFAGVIEVCWDESEKKEPAEYKGQSESEMLSVLNSDDEDIIELDEKTELVYDENGQPQTITTYDFTTEITNKLPGKVKYYNIPPEEFMISKDATNFEDAKLIGRRTYVTRSKLIEMKFDKKVVDGLPRTSRMSNTDVARKASASSATEIGSGTGLDPASDFLELCKYYLQADIRQKGVCQLWQIFKVGDVILDKKQVGDHPFACWTPIIMPHQAIGDCPANQVQDIQKRKSVMTRQLLNNITKTNFSRKVINDDVEIGDVLTAGNGPIRVNNNQPVGNAIMEMPVQPIGGEILQAIESATVEREARTGIPRSSQGVIDTEALTQTATQFKGLSDAGQQRLRLYARVLAETGLKQLFKKTIDMVAKNQDTARQIKILGKPFEINPSKWRQQIDCMIEVGTGNGERIEELGNLNAILEKQKILKESGSVLVDDKKIYNTLKRLTKISGFKDVSIYFNDPEVPEQVLKAENEQLKAKLQELEQQMKNPLAEAEQEKAKGAAIIKQLDHEHDLNKLVLTLRQEQEQFMKNLQMKLTELELKYQSNVPGALV